MVGPSRVGKTNSEGSILGLYMLSLGAIVVGNTLECTNDFLSVPYKEC